MRLVALLIAVIFSQLTYSQNTYLWKVSSSENDKISYLFGTHHQLGESYFKKYHILEKSLMSCQLVVTEVEISRDSVKSIFEGREPVDLQSMLGAKNYNQVKEVLKGFSLNLGKLTPGELVGSLQREFESLNCNALVESDKHKLDEYIQIVARQSGKANQYLETMDEQFRYLDQTVKNKMTWKDARRYVELILKQYNKFQKSGRSTCPPLLDRYINRAIDYQFSKACAGFKDKQQILIVKRNEQWLKELSKLMRQGNVFIAVGAEHLIYECGLIMQLKKIGYNVEPVPM